MANRRATPRFLYLLRDYENRERAEDRPRSRFRVVRRRREPDVRHGQIDGPGLVIESPAHLAVLGTSAGGIAVGGAITQHPEHFAAAVDNVGVTDMLRFQITQGGAANIPEFGNLSQKED